jgi:hypothetical protein
MNGEVKSYRLNDPMTWAEFQGMPDELKTTYIKLIREKYCAPDQHIGRMLGVCQTTIAKEVRRLGISNGRGAFKPKWDKEAFYAWCYGAGTQAPVSEPAEDGEAATVAPVRNEPQSGNTSGGCGTEAVLPAVPECGNLTFECYADQALAVLAKILCNEHIHLIVQWDVVPEPEKGAVCCED